MLTAVAPSPVSSRHREVSRCLSCGSPHRQPLFTRDGFLFVTCTDCGLAYLRNPLTAEELSRFYSFASNYHAGFRTSESLRNQFLERGRTYLRYLSRHRQQGALLDVGCSAGFFLKVAQDAGWQVQGLEFSPDSAQLGRELFGCDIQVGSLLNHDLPAESFDALTLWDVIEHLPEPLAEMRQAHDLLRPGGLVAISTPNIAGLFPQLSYQVAGLINYWTHIEPPAHLTQFSVRTLSELLQRAGFEIVAATTRRIPLDYSFGTISELVRMPKRLLYALVFAPAAAIGPWLGMGDEVVLIARRPR